ncbi:S-layer protein, C-terminal [Bacillus mobilis]|nr:S-layer protein, C-terminal [Bacillus mobilis]
MNERHICVGNDIFLYLSDNNYHLGSCVAFIHIKVADTYDVIFKTYKEQTNENMKLPKECADLNNHWGAKYDNILIQENISVGTDNGWAPDKAVSSAIYCEDG